MPKSKIKKLPGSKVELEVQLTDAEFKPYWERARQIHQSTLTIKGFRPGAAPKELIEQATDHDKVFQEAVRVAVKESMHELTEQQQWTLIDQPHVEVKDAKDGVTYAATLTVFPEVELGNYRRIAKRVFSEKKEMTIDAAEIEKTINWIRASRAKEIRVIRPTKRGDLVEINLESSTEGKIIPGATFRGDRFIVGESHFIKGFDEKVEGHKEGEHFDFSLTAPADYWQKNLQNKQIDFKATLNGVYERELPAFNNEFASTLGPNFKTTDDIKKSITEGLLQEKEEKEKERLRLKVLDEIVVASKVDLPEIMVERTLDGLVEDVKGMLPPETEKSPEETVKELRTQLRKKAEANVASNLVLFAIAKAEKLEPTKEEVEADAKANNVDLEKHYDYSYGRVQNQKVFKFLEEEAKK